MLTRMRDFALTIVASAPLSSGCSATSLTRFVGVAPSTPHADPATIEVHEGDAMQPRGFRPIALIRSEGTWFLSRSAMISALQSEAANAGCTVLFVSEPRHDGPMPIATALCGIVESESTGGH